MSRALDLQLSVPSRHMPILRRRMLSIYRLRETKGANFVWNRKLRLAQYVRYFVRPVGYVVLS